jgi:hypothetical protein
VDSLNPKQRDVVLVSELITDECLEGSVQLNGSGLPVNAITLGIKPKGRLLLQQLEKEETDASLIRKHRDEFQSVDHRQLSVMDDKTLAAWQSNFRQDEPEWRIAEYEWQRRITAKQIRAGRWNAFLALAGVVVGALLTYLLSADPRLGEVNGSSNPPALNPTSRKTNNQQQASAPVHSALQSFPVPTTLGQTNSPVQPAPRPSLVPPAPPGRTNLQPNP